VERGLVESRTRAQAIILAGRVLVRGRMVDKASALIEVDAEIECPSGDEWVSRGAFKLLHALERFPLTVAGRTALDAGASTGGFTEVLLRAGATRVYAVDVGYGQLSWKLRTDPRVVVYERTNVRYLNDLPERASLVVADLSFISLTLVLGRLVALAEPDADFILLVKPQFEAGRAEVGKGGVVRDPVIHRAVLEKTTAAAETHGLQLHGATASPILGPAGNVEFLAWYSHGEAALEPAAHLDRALAEAATITRLKPDDAPTPGSAPDPANATHGAAR